SKEVCEVCGDRASGHHYGVLSCEGCKAFFKRAITKDLRYECMRNNKCVITKETRSRCPSCRLNKCEKQGMR
ncbi:hypothetical protein PENTCL1PPCAC_13114, partial [Pristionchus entomophagus]